MKFFFIAILSLTAFVGLVSAQTKDEKAVTEITAFREKIIEAIKKRDKNALDKFYAEDFTHTHASGKVDDKTQRLNTLVSGETTIETAETNEIKIRLYGKDTAVAIGQSSITFDAGTIAKFRWTLTYFKSGKTWQIVASHATRTAENK